MGIVPQPMLIAVGVKDNWSPAELILQAICIELGLVLSDLRTLPRALGLDQGQWPAVNAPEDIIHESPPVFTGHAGNGELGVVAGLAEGPTRFAQEQVDEAVPGLGFGIVVGVGLRGVGSFRVGNLAAQAGNSASSAVLSDSSAESFSSRSLSSFSSL